MNKYKYHLIVFFIIALCISYATAEQNISGKWIMDVQSEFGSGTPTFELVQEGETVTGTYQGQLGESQVTGTVKGNKVELNFKAEGMGQEMTIQYIGTLEEDGSMKGTVKLGDFGEGTFTGKKEEK